MHAGARLRNEPEARPNTQLNTYSPASVLPNGSQMANMANTPRHISPDCVLMRPYLSAMPPAIRRPRVENLEMSLACEQTGDARLIHVDDGEHKDAGGIAESLHDHIGRVKTQTRKYFQLETYRYRQSSSLFLTRNR